MVSVFRFSSVVAFAFSLLTAASAWAQTAQPVGEVVAQRGAATAMRNGQPVSLSSGSSVFVNDQIFTYKGSGVKLKFTDGSEVSVGEEGLLQVDRFAHDRPTNTRNALFTFVRGIFRATVASLAPASSWDVRTETAVASVRSTDWMLAARADLAEVFVHEGSVAVRNIKHPLTPGEVMLFPGDGTDVRPDARPTGPVRWGPPRINNFNARTTVP